MKLPIIALIAALLLGATSTQAGACSSMDPPLTREQQFAKASAVFAAHLFQTEEIANSQSIQGHSEPLVEASFRTIEIIKGQPPQGGKVKSFIFGPGNCSVPLVAGMDYVFFLYSDSDNMVLVLPGGNEAYWSIKQPAAEETLKELRELGKRRR